MSVAVQEPETVTAAGAEVMAEHACGQDKDGQDKVEQEVDSEFSAEDQRISA